MSIRTHIIIEAIREVLANDTLIQQQASHGVFAHRLPAFPEDATWGRLVVRELDTNGLPEHTTGLVSLPVQVMVEVMGIPNPELLLAATHERIEEVLSAFKPETDFGAALDTIRRRRRPSTPQHDQDAFYSTATYECVLRSSQESQ